MMTKREHYLGLLIALGCFANQPAAAQWIRQAPNPTGNNLSGVAMLTAQHGFLSTSTLEQEDSGSLFETFDGGATWTQRDVSTSNGDFLNGIFFLDDQLGWGFGNDNFRTTDSGATWQKLPFLGSTYFMRFYTTTFGYASSNGGLFVSRNGGLNWSPSPNNLHSFSFRDDQTGLGVSTNNGLYQTTNGGQTFALVRAGNGEAVAYLSTNVALGIVADTIVRSTNGGQAWSDVTAALGFNRLAPLSDQTVLAFRSTGTFNTDGRLRRSTDGGLTWTDLGTVVPDGISSIETLDSQTAVIISSTADVWRSSTGGLTWTRTLAAPTLGLNTWPVAFADGQAGMLAIGSGLVYRTEDGGVTWTQISSGYGGELLDVDRFSDGRLIAVGRGGVALTSDDGAFWIVEDTGGASDLTAVDVVDDLSVVAADVFGLVYRSTDRGRTWTAGTAYPDPFFEFLAYDLHFSTALDGWVVGTRFNFPAVYHSTDGGNSWQSIPFPGLWTGVDFEGNSGWVVDDGGGLLRTTDGGQNWTLSFLPFNPTDVLDIEFFDQNVGYAVGWNGYAVRSADGGQTWSRLPTPNSSDRLSDLHLLGPNDVWASTYDDRAYHSTDGGQTWEVLEIRSAPDSFGSFSGIAASAGGQVWTVGFGGFIYSFGESPESDLVVDIVPVNPPVVIPPEGGTFQYIVTVENNSTTSQSLDLWFTIATPNNREIPRGPFSLNLAPGASFTRTLSQKIPRGAPAGSYTLTASAGTFPDEAEESDSFSFEKLPGAPEKPLR